MGGNFSYIDMRSLTRYVTGTQQESKNYKERVPAIPYMYGNGEAGLTLRDVFVKGNSAGHTLYDELCPEVQLRVECVPECGT